MFSDINVGLPWVAITAITVGLDLSLLVSNNTGVANSEVYPGGLMQRVPSLALLGLMIVFFGIRVSPAIIALFFYSLLPIVRNEVTALSGGYPMLVGVSRAITLGAVTFLAPTVVHAGYICGYSHSGCYQY